MPKQQRPPRWFIPAVILIGPMLIALVAALIAIA